MTEDENRLSVDPYKGTRDFYPEEMFRLKYLFSTMRAVAESYGYAEYGGPTLEPTNLYTSKTSEEIISEQSYTFIDRGNRSLTLRPEMTPTVARMVAAKRRDLSFPLRWYSLATLFRYEQPQKGRLREHFQFNADIFGIESLEAEVENITLAGKILLALGASYDDFEIRVGSRTLLSSLLSALSISKEHERKLSRTIDRKEKMSQEDFEKTLSDIIGSDAKDLLSLIEAKDFAEFLDRLPPTFSDEKSITEMQNVLLGLTAAGFRNAKFSPSLVRGFDYYSGIVFEIFDTNPENRRSLAGGGRYNNLLSIFGEEKIPAVGFGMGDVTLLEFLRTRELLPSYTPPARLYLAQAPGASPDFVQTLAGKFREKGIGVAVDYSGKRVGDQIRSAVKQGYPFLITLGEEETTSGRLPLKDLLRETEEKLSIEEALQKLLS